MANIYAFPPPCEPIVSDDALLGNASSLVHDVSLADKGDRRGIAAPASGHLPVRPKGVPDVVWDAVVSVRTMRRLDAVHYREIPVSRQVCDFGIGVAMQTDATNLPDSGMSRHVSFDEASCEGWLTMLYSRTPFTDAPPSAQESNWRCLAYARVPMNEHEDDALASSMYWDDLREQLSPIVQDSLRGTVSITKNTSFSTPDHPWNLSCELRASWVPLKLPDGGVDAGSQVTSIAEFLGSMARFEGDVIIG